MIQIIDTVEEPVKCSGRGSLSFELYAIRAKADMLKVFSWKTRCTACKMPGSIGHECKHEVIATRHEVLHHEYFDALNKSVSSTHGPGTWTNIPDGPYVPTTHTNTNKGDQ